jgi:hypothetical protein
LLVALPVRWIAAKTGDSRRRVLLSTATSLAVALMWIVPMSSKYGHPTLGSSGALNWSWYIKANTSRLPDTDGGANSAYHEVGVGNGRLLQLAVFDNAERWTYEPWGDPTEWSTKVVTETGHNPTAFELVTYWLRMFARVFGLWLGPLIVGTLVPWVVLHRRKDMHRELLNDQRDALVVIVLGFIGLMQFVAVHAEPRLLAPFAAMLALGVLHWAFAGAYARAKETPVRLAAGWLGVAVAIGFAVPRISGGIESATRLSGVTAQLSELRRRISAVSSGPLPIAVVGPAAPIMASAFLVNAHIAYQISPAYASLVATLPKEEQSQMLITLFRGKVPMLWRTSSDGGMEMLIVPEK